MTDPKKMTIEEILAACRQGTSGQGEEKSKAAAASEAPASAASSGEKPAAEPKPKPAAVSAAAKGDPGKMSVADILAAARGEKQPKPPTAAKAASAPAATAAVAATPAKKAVEPVAKDRGPLDTSSILAAARKASKPGPLSKEEAAKKAVAATPDRPILPPKPERPAYAMPKPAVSSEEQPSRRGFLSVLFGSFLAVGFTCMGAVGGLWSLGLARFMFPNILTEPPSRFKVGFPADFPPDSVATNLVAQYGVWIVNTLYEGQRQIVALRTVCTHLGCTPNWLDSERKFKCPCHGSGFYIDGINFEGPAPRPLERYAIRTADDGQLEVDKSRKFQQEMGQWNNPACFVKV